MSVILVLWKAEAEESQVPAQPGQFGYLRVPFLEIKVIKSVGDGPQWVQSLVQKTVVLLHPSVYRPVVATVAGLLDSVRVLPGSLEAARAFVGSFTRLPWHPGRYIDWGLLTAAPRGRVSGGQLPREGH